MKRTILTITTALAMLTTASAFANDNSFGFVSKSPSADYTPVEFGSGWYIRGDITYNIDGRSEQGFSNIAGVGNIQTDYDDAVGARVGFGYRLNPNFRLEFAAEAIFSTEFDGLGAATYSATDAFDPGVGSTGGTRRTTGEYSATDFIFNAYLDLGTFGRFTPYVGAGGGIARINLRQSSTLTCVPSAATVACTGLPAGGAGATAAVTLVTDESVWTHAYQLSAGTAIAIDENLSLDIGYSFTQIGDGDEIDYADGTAIDSDGVQLHQVRAGIRYDLF